MFNDGYTDFPGGYCVLESTASCVPEGGVPLSVDNASFTEEVWVKSCSSDDDCRDSYACEYWINACLPKRPLEIIIDENYRFQSLCEGFDENGNNGGGPVIITP